MAVAPSIDVTVHRHGQPALTITGSVVGMRWSHSISAPWQSLTVAWKAAVRDSFLVSVGDWVVVRAGYGDDPRKGPVLAWGHVDDVDGGATMQPNGALMSDTIQLKCSSWWGLLHTVNLYSVTGWADDIGTLLSMETWAKTITSVVEDYQVGSLSKAFQALLSKLAAVKLPSTMVPGYPDATLGDLIPLVHDSDTRDLYAPERIVESVDIGGGLPNQLTSKIPSYESSVGELLSGTFVPEAMLIELFPSFERFPETEVVPQSPPTNPALAKFLGGWETLIYRIKPFRHTPLRESTVAYASYTHTDVEKAVADAMAAFNNATTPLSFLQAVSARNAATQGLPTRNSTWSLFVGDTTEILKNYFKDRTWGYTGIVDSPSGPKDRKEPYPKWVDKPILRSISINRSDKSRVNASTLAIAPDPSAGSVDAVKTFGLPITYDEEIRRHGLRMLKPTWTFVVPAASVTPAPSATQTLLSPGQSVLKALSPTRDGNYLPYMRSICAQLMQFYKNGHLYATGTMQLNLLEAWRLDPTKSHQTFFNKVLDLKAGHTMAVTMSGSDVFYAYAESVEHNFTVQDGGIQTAATTVSYTRGHFGVEEDALANVAVPMREVTAVSKAPPRTNRTRGGRPRPYGTYPAISCDMGEEVTAFPADRSSIDWSRVPDWLVDWGVSRGMSASAFSAASDVRYNARVAAATACVIEYYWRQIDRNAVITIIPGTGHLRQPLQGIDTYERHTSGAGIDFSILAPAYLGGLAWPRIPAFQSWGGLYRLVRAKRIPPGAKGLYLNISPSTYHTVDPTIPQNAGVPSKHKRQPAGSPPYSLFPAGGSGGTHYDFSGAFGFEGLNYNYVWADANGDGEDDWTYEGHHSVIFDKIGPYARDYFLHGGSGDAHLPEVGLKVPNVMQVLGQVESCFAEEPPGGVI